MYHFVEQIKNTVNNLPITKYMILQQTIFAIWGDKKNQMNGMKHLLSDWSLGIYHWGEDKSLWTGEEMQSENKILGRGSAWGEWWCFSASTLCFSVAGSGWVKSWMSTNGKQELSWLWWAFHQVVSEWCANNQRYLCRELPWPVTQPHTATLALLHQLFT